MSELYCEYYASSIGKNANDTQKTEPHMYKIHKNIQKHYEYSHNRRLYTKKRMNKYAHIQEIPG